MSQKKLYNQEINCNAIKLKKGFFVIFFKNKKITKTMFSNKNFKNIGETTSNLHKFIEYFSGKRKKIKINVDINNYSDFEKKVWDATKKIPYGKTVSYSQLAEKIGNKTLARAVGKALGKNPFPVIIPCHRVIGKNGKLTGFSSGLKWKKMLLELEREGKKMI